MVVARLHSLKLSCRASKPETETVTETTADHNIRMGRGYALSSCRGEPHCPPLNQDKPRDTSY